MGKCPNCNINLLVWDEIEPNRWQLFCSRCGYEVDVPADSLLVDVNETSALKELSPDESDYELGFST